MASAGGRIFRKEVLETGDTLKKLRRSRYLLSKHSRLWNKQQQKSAILLFERYPEVEQAYELAIALGNIYNHCTSKEHAFKHPAL